MNYLVTALVEASAEVEPGKTVYWKVGDERWVDREYIAYYQDRTDAFTVTAVTSYPTTEDLFVAGYARATIDFNTAGEAGTVITIGDYEFSEADTAVAASGVWTNGANAATSATSLKAAINALSDDFTAYADASGDGLVLIADTAGVNTWALSTEIDTNMTSIPAALLTFSDACEAGTEITINGITFSEADTADAATGVWTNGASAADTVTSLVAAINTDARSTVPFTAVANTGGDGVYLIYDSSEATDPFTITHDSAAILTVTHGFQAILTAAATEKTYLNIDGTLYVEAGTAAATTGVWTNGADAAASVTSLAAALNDDERDSAADVLAEASSGGDELWITWTDADTVGTYTIGAYSSACTVSPAFYGGSAIANKRTYQETITVTAQEIVGGALDIPLPFAPSVWTVQVFSATGEPIYFTDLVTAETEPNRLRITTDGATNIAATNVIHLTVTE